MQISGTGSWVCSLAPLGPPSQREGALCMANSTPHWLLVIYQLAGDQELLQAAFPADSNVLIVLSVLSRNTFLCLKITNEKLDTLPSLHYFFLDLGEVIPSKRRHPVIEFAVTAERDASSSALVIEGMNLNPCPNLPSCT